MFIQSFLSVVCYRFCLMVAILLFSVLLFWGTGVEFRYACCIIVVNGSTALSMSSFVLCLYVILFHYRPKEFPINFTRRASMVYT